MGQFFECLLGKKIGEIPTHMGQFFECLREKQKIGAIPMHMGQSLSGFLCTRLERSTSKSS